MLPTFRLNKMDGGWCYTYPKLKHSQGSCPGFRHSRISHVVRTWSCLQFYGRNWGSYGKSPSNSLCPFLELSANPYEFSLPSRESGDVLYFCSLCLRSNYLSHLDVLHTICDFLSPEFALVLSVIVIMLSPPLFSCIKEYRVHLQQRCFTHIDPWIIKLETVPEWSLVPKMIRWHTEPSISFYLSLIWLLEVF